MAMIVAFGEIFGEIFAEILIMLCVVPLEMEIKWGRASCHA